MIQWGWMAIHSPRQHDRLHPLLLSQLQIFLTRARKRARRQLKIISKPAA